VVETIALMQAVSLMFPDPLARTSPQTYMYSMLEPGAMPMNWVMSSVCSVSSQALPPLSTQLVPYPPVEMRVGV